MRRASSRPTEEVRRVASNGFVVSRAFSFAFRPLYPVRGAASIESAEKAPFLDADLHSGPPSPQKAHGEESVTQARTSATNGQLASWPLGSTAVAVSSKDNTVPVENANPVKVPGSSRRRPESSRQANPFGSANSAWGTNNPPFTHGSFPVKWMFKEAHRCGASEQPKNDKFQ